MTCIVFRCANNSVSFLGRSLRHSRPEQAVQYRGADVAAAAVVWHLNETGDGPVTIAPLLTLYDYSFGAPRPTTARNAPAI